MSLPFACSYKLHTTDFPGSCNISQEIRSLHYTRATIYLGNFTTATISPGGEISCDTAMRPHREKVGVTPLTNTMAEPEAPDPEGQLVTACHLSDVSSLYCISHTELPLVSSSQIWGGRVNNLCEHCLCKDACAILYYTPHHPYLGY